MAHDTGSSLRTRWSLAGRRGEHGSQLWHRWRRHEKNTVKNTQGNNTDNLGHGFKRTLEGESWRGNGSAHPEVDFTGSETVVGPLLFTDGTGGGEMGVAGRAGVVGVTGVTGVGGMLESLRLSWLCSEGPAPRTFTEPSLLLDFYTRTGSARTRA